MGATKHLEIEIGELNSEDTRFTGESKGTANTVQRQTFINKPHADEFLSKKLIAKGNLATSLCCFSHFRLERGKSENLLLTF